MSALQHAGSVDLLRRAELRKKGGAASAGSNARSMVWIVLHASPGRAVIRG